MSTDQGVRVMLAAFERQARPLQYQDNAEALPALAFRGVLRSPTPSELAGGLDQSTRVVVCRASVFTSAGITPRIKDSILDPDDGGRRYSIEWDPQWLYVGSSRRWWRAEVIG